MQDQDSISPHERILIDVALKLTTSLDLTQVCAATLDAAWQVTDARSGWLMLVDEARSELVTVEFRGPGADTYANVRVPLKPSSLTGIVFSSRDPLFVADVRAESRWFNPERVWRSGLRSALLIPVMYNTRPAGVLGIDSPRFTEHRPPSPAELERLRGIAAHGALAIRNARLVENIEQDRARLRRLLAERRQLRQEVGHLRDEVRSAHSFTTVLGDSRIWRNVLEQVQLVAPADSTVLLSGETGTGKELVARAIHAQSGRRRGPFIAINCAAFPESLVESELFGHERGAFTGAFERKLGKFELADKGTLFLDEVGELPAAVQAKLLRALQEREVQRIGGTRPISVNVRVIAATNRDLQAALRDGSFRQDLFYRLSVFPITLPPLRERCQDVALLATHFVRRFAERQGKRVPTLTPAARDALDNYPWPGNVRELQNVLERAVILCRGTELDADLLYLPARIASPPSESEPPSAPATGTEPTATVISFSEAERRAILEALDTCGWRISGSGGAAELLGLKPTTLHAKMKRLGVRRPTAAREDTSGPRPL